MKKSEYYSKLKKAVDEGFAEYQAKLKEYNKLKAKRDAGQFAPDYLHKEIIPKMQNMKMDMVSIQNRVKSESRKLANIEKEVRAKADRLNPADLTDDVKLLQGGLILKSADIEGILERNKGNRTMQQLALRFANEHNIKVNAVYESASADNSYDSINGVVDTLVRWFDSDDESAYRNIYNIIFGENSAFAQEYSNSDSEE